MSDAFTPATRIHLLVREAEVACESGDHCHAPSPRPLPRSDLGAPPGLIARHSRVSVYERWSSVLTFLCFQTATELPKAIDAQTFPPFQVRETSCRRGDPRLTGHVLAMTVLPPRPMIQLSKAVAPSIRGECRHSERTSSSSHRPLRQFVADALARPTTLFHLR